jgi:hypothetical protein
MVDCRPIRERIDAVETTIAEISEDLSDPDIPAAVKRSLRQKLASLRLLLRRLQAALKACEAATR